MTAIPQTIQNTDIKALKEAILRTELEILELAKRPNFNEEELFNKRIILKYYRRMVNIHETKNGGASA